MLPLLPSSWSLLQVRYPSLPKKLCSTAFEPTPFHRTLGPSTLLCSLGFCRAASSAAGCTAGRTAISWAAAPAPIPAAPSPTSIGLTPGVSGTASPVCGAENDSPSLHPASLPAFSDAFASIAAALKGGGVLAAATFEGDAPEKESAASILLKRASTRSVGKADTGRLRQSQSHFSGGGVEEGQRRATCVLSFLSRGEGTKDPQTFCIINACV